MAESDTLAPWAEIVPDAELMTVDDLLTLPDDGWQYELVDGRLVHPTPYADVNAVLHDFLARIRLILGERFRGMYLDGSLALGDFAPHSSDIDFVVTTDAQLSDDLFMALRDMHARFDASGSPWATEIEAVYIPRDALRRDNPAPAAGGSQRKTPPVAGGWPDGATAHAMIAMSHITKIYRMGEQEVHALTMAQVG